MARWFTKGLVDNNDTITVLKLDGYIRKDFFQTAGFTAMISLSFSLDITLTKRLNSAQLGNYSQMHNTFLSSEQVPQKIKQCFII
jgi:hypothetical protein